MGLHWLLRMRQWAQHPPPARVVYGVLAIIALCAALYGIELIWGWPAALTPNGGGLRRGVTGM
nr:hypothetical protein [Roseicitreum antarcticum]